jgi:hypothetical protein
MWLENSLPAQPMLARVLPSVDVLPGVFSGVAECVPADPGWLVQPDEKSWRS